MLIIESPNSWSCMPAAFATATGVPIERILLAIGHDGSEVIFPDLDDPVCRRGFHPQELCKALLEFHFLFATFERSFIGFLDDLHHWEEDEEQFFELLIDSIGVLGVKVRATGQLHAVAWDGLECYDPSGFRRPLEYYEPYVYYRLGKC